MFWKHDGVAAGSVLTSQGYVRPALAVWFVQASEMHFPVMLSLSYFSRVHLVTHLLMSAPPMSWKHCGDSVEFPHGQFMADAFVRLVHVFNAHLPVFMSGSWCAAVHIVTHFDVLVPPMS